EADLLIHVVDAASPERDRQMTDVEVVLKEIGADTLPRLTVMNKIDQLEDRAPEISHNEAGEIDRVWMSAQSGLGMDLLRQALGERLRPTRTTINLFLPASLGGLRARWLNEGAIVAEKWQDDEMHDEFVQPGWQLTLSLTQARWAQWRKHHPELEACLAAPA
ncbi:MAG: GTPase HflX, partial [Halothiobacillus sp.]|nr:GTPase HflX [Halothiobacillus sp.]